MYDKNIILWHYVIATKSWIDWKSKFIYFNFYIKINSNFDCSWKKVCFVIWEHGGWGGEGGPMSALGGWRDCAPRVGSLDVLGPRLNQSRLRRCPSTSSELCGADGASPILTSCYIMFI